MPFFAPSLKRIRISLHKVDTVAKVPATKFKRRERESQKLRKQKEAGVAHAPAEGLFYGLGGDGARGERRRHRIDRRIRSKTALLLKR
jgi:hypothetical protein